MLHKVLFGGRGFLARFSFILLSRTAHSGFGSQRIGVFLLWLSGLARTFSWSVFLSLGFFLFLSRFRRASFLDQVVLPANLF